MDIYFCQPLTMKHVCKVVFNLEPPRVCRDGRQSFPLRCRGGHQCKLIHTLRTPLAEESTRHLWNYYIYLLPITSENILLSIRFWSRQLHQTASCIHLLRHIHSGWAHWYAVHRHILAALHSYSHTIWPRFGSAGSLVDLKWFHNVIVEAITHLKLASRIHLRYIQSVFLNLTKIIKFILPPTRKKVAYHFENSYLAKYFFNFYKISWLN